MRKLKDVLDEQGRWEADDRDLRSRSDASKERHVEADALLTLARRIAELSDKQFTKLTLDEGVHDTILAARRISSPNALNRQLKLVRRALRGIDWLELADEIEELECPGRGQEPAVEPAKLWSRRLIGGGDEVVTALLVDAPGLDRSDLRQAVRNARKAATGGPRRFEQKLIVMIRAGLPKLES